MHKILCIKHVAKAREYFAWNYFKKKNIEALVTVLLMVASNAVLEAQNHFLETSPKSALLCMVIGAVKSKVYQIKNYMYYLNVTNAIYNHQNK